MTFSPRKLFLVLLCCAVVAWFAGAAGRMLVVLLLLLFGPGYLFERACPFPRPAAPLVLPALWLGLSISLVGLLYTWTTLLGIALSPLPLTVLAAACGGAVVWQVWRTSPADVQFPRYHLWLWGWLALFVLSVGVRFVQIQNLALPPWVDSVHHALLIRVAAEQGLAPYSLRPYLPVDNLPYHWGYHVFMAAVMQLSGLALPQVMLWGGQILNALHVLTCAALANSFWRRPLAGVVAGLVVGLISIMPAYYVSWGRYTQLTGLLLLPALAMCWHSWLVTPARTTWLHTTILLAGLSVIHFRVLVLALALMAAIAVVWALQQHRWHSIGARLLGAVGMATAAVALALPWLWQLAQRRLAPALHDATALIGGGSYNELNEGLLWAGQNRLLLALALLAAFWGVFRRSRAAAVFLCWVGMLAVIANPWLLGYLLPMLGILLAAGSISQRQPLLMLISGVLLLCNPLLMTFHYLWLITNDVVVISLFIPFGLCIAGGACFLYAWLQRTFPTAPTLLAYGLAGVLAALAIWGTWNAQDVINPVTVFATPADAAAIAWVDTHTPPDARFLINATGWFSHVDRGADGGWWIMPLTGRWTTTPPAIYEYGAPDYVQQVFALSREIAGFQPGQEQSLYQLILREHITHIYLGSQSGAITPASFANNAAFRQVYQRDGVTILEVEPAALLALVQP